MKIIDILSIMNNFTPEYLSHSSIRFLSLKSIIFSQKGIFKQDCTIVSIMLIAKTSAVTNITTLDV